jgi:hypothetical protein
MAATNWPIEHRPSDATHFPFRFPHALQHVGKGNGKSIPYPSGPRQSRTSLATFSCSALRSTFPRPGRSSRAPARAANVNDGASAPPAGPPSLTGASTLAASGGTGEDIATLMPINCLDQPPINCRVPADRTPSAECRHTAGRARLKRTLKLLVSAIGRGFPSPSATQTTYYRSLQRCAGNPCVGWLTLSPFVWTESTGHSRQRESDAHLRRSRLSNRGVNCQTRSTSTGAPYLVRNTGVGVGDRGAHATTNRCLPVDPTLKRTVIHTF